MSKRKTRFPVHITKECILNSQRNSLHWCIYALGIAHSIKGSTHIAVDANETRFSYRGHRYVFKTPERTARIAAAYDKGLVSKEQIQPWTDALVDLVSCTPQERREYRALGTPKQKASKQSKRKPSCRKRAQRWAGVRL